MSKYYVALSGATLAPHVICLANHAGESLYIREERSFATLRMTEGHRA